MARLAVLVWKEDVVGAARFAVHQAEEVVVEVAEVVVETVMAESPRQVVSAVPMAIKRDSFNLLAFPVPGPWDVVLARRGLPEMWASVRQRLLPSPLAEPSLGNRVVFSDLHPALQLRPLKREDEKQLK